MTPFVVLLLVLFPTVLFASDCIEGGVNCNNKPLPFPSDRYCTCQYNRIWLDIVFVVDSSDDMTQQGLTNVNMLLQNSMLVLDLGGKPFQSRVGAVVYAKNSRMVYGLDSIRNPMDISNFYLDYLGGDGSNIKSGISLAAEMLNQVIEGRNARKVIVVIASAYREGDQNDPTQEAHSFKNSGGNIVTIAFVNKGEDGIPMLRDIASDGFAFTNTDLNFSASTMISAFCKANCFCPPRLTGFSSAGSSIPDRGCFEYVNLAAVVRAATQKCVKSGGQLINIHDDETQQFITGLASPRTAVWINLSRNTTGGKPFTWGDGVDYGSGYSQWATGQPAATGDCVYSQQSNGFNAGWYTDDCLKSHQYICQTRPCDTLHNCLQ